MLILNEPPDPKDPVDEELLAQIVVQPYCKDCQGSGRYVRYPCGNCRESGVEWNPLGMVSLILALTYERKDYEERLEGFQRACTTANDLWPSKKAQDILWNACHGQYPPDSKPRRADA